MAGGGYSAGVHCSTLQSVHMAGMAIFLALWIASRRGERLREREKLLSIGVNVGVSPINHGAKARGEILEVEEV